MNNNQVNIFEDKTSLANFFGQLIYERTLTNSKVTLALSGGSTPKAIFDVLAQNYKNTIDWNKLHLYWGDERCVPPTHEESNYKMTVDHLISKVSIPETNIHRIPGEEKVEEAVKFYEEHIIKTVDIIDNTPVFDILILGMGTDGHTASIFPHQINLWDSESICAAAQHPDSGQNRVSLTGKVINNAKEIFFLVTGDDKKEKVDEILNKKGNYKLYPASYVKNAVWLLDKDAASKL